MTSLQCVAEYRTSTYCAFSHSLVNRETERPLSTWSKQSEFNTKKQAEWLKLKFNNTHPVSEQLVFRKLRSIYNEQLASTINEIDSYGTLADGWDGFDAGPIKKAVRDQAITFLQSLPQHIAPPCPAPSADNEIVLEWAKKDDEIILSFYGDGFLHGYADYKGDDLFFEENIDELSELLIQVLTDLS